MHNSSLCSFRLPMNQLREHLHEQRLLLLLAMSSAFPCSPPGPAGGCLALHAGGGAPLAVVAGAMMQHSLESLLSNQRLPAQSGSRSSASNACRGGRAARLLHHALLLLMPMTRRLAARNAIGYHSCIQNGALF